MFVTSLYPVSFYLSSTFSKYFLFIFTVYFSFLNCQNFLTILVGQLFTLRLALRALEAEGMLICVQFRQQNFSNRNCVLHSQIAVCAFTYIKFSGRFKLFIRKPHLQPDRIVWQKVKYCTQIGVAVCKFCPKGSANLPNAIRCFSIQKSLKSLFHVMVKLRPSDKTIL